MKPKTLTVLILVIFLTSCITSFNLVYNCKAVEPKFYVDDDYDSTTPGWQVDHFDKIQDAIDNALSGDRIVVYAGTYNENIVVDKRLDIFGEERNLTFIDGSDTGTVVWITSQYVNFSHFTIRDSGSNSYDAMIKVNSGNAIITDNVITSGQNGILVSNCNSNTIYDNIIKTNSGVGVYLNQSNSNSVTYNTIMSNSHGVFLYSSSSNTVSNNAMKSNSLNGVFLNETSNSNTLSNNNISSNTLNGIFLNDHCNYNTISNNEIHENSDSGIRLENSSINTLNSNMVNSSTDYGIMIVGSSNIIQGNAISFNTDHGMFLFADDHNTISDNTIWGNSKDGIRLYNSTNDSIYRNKIKFNTVYGVYLDYFTFDNQITNNMFQSNTYNAMDKSSGSNSWNILKTSGTNIISGPYLGGNYWDDYTGSDSDGDGLGDTAYTIYAGNKDNLPIVDINAPSISNVAVSPSSQTTGGYVKISAKVTDNIGVNNVYIVLTNPSNSTTTITITQNKTGNQYYSNTTYTTVGTYSFYIKAKDAKSNWATTSTTPTTFAVVEGVPPTVTDNSPSTGSPGGSFTFNATVTDDEDTASELTVTVTWTHDTSSGTNTMTNTGGNYFAYTMTLSSSTSSLTYYITATDSLSNSVTTSTTTVTLSDSTPPTITINSYGPTPDTYPNSYTFNVKVTDNDEVSSVTIEYWYGSSSHMTTSMTSKGSDIYEKMIIPETTVDNVYCIIYATDPSGNQANTKNPTAEANGPYAGSVTVAVTFDSTDSFDLDGNITSYSWSFGDGTTGTGASPTHTYSTDGIYSVTLTVTDNDGYTDTDTSTATIGIFTQTTTSEDTLDDLNDIYDLTLTELFYAYDTDSDGTDDLFIDPNGVLDAIHTDSLSINDHATFLLSVNDDLDDVFIWDSQDDTVTQVTHSIGEITDEVEDEDEGTITIVATVEKTDWIYMEVEDRYTGVSDVTVQRDDGTTVSSDFIWRKDSKIYILDDPSTEYNFIYHDAIETAVLENAIFDPEAGGEINENNPTLTMTYTVPVTVTYANFHNIMTGEKVDITNELTTDDNMVFKYTPDPELESGLYELDMSVTEIGGTSFVQEYATFNFVSYTVQGEGIPLNLILMMLGGIFGVAAVLFLLSRLKIISFDGFIYIKNRKIIPFFKPVVFGPLHIDVDDEKVCKAEFFVNGDLKETLTEAPYVWKWNEKAFLKHTVEAKVYNEEGKGVSSGEMTFYMFNPSRPFK